MTAISVRNRYDFVVVGGGIAGASAAWALSQHGLTLLIEGEAHPGYHSTGRSSAAFIQGYGNAVVRRLNAAAWDFFCAPPVGFSEGDLTSRCGLLIVAGPDRYPAIKAMGTAQSAEGISNQVLDPTAARACVPVLDGDWVSGAVLDPAASHIDVDRLLQSYLKGLRRQGGDVALGKTATCAREGSGHWVVRIGEQSTRAPVVVNATGAWGDGFAKTAGVKPLGLQVLKRTVALIDLPSGLEAHRWPIVMDIDETFYFKPDAGRLICSAADETPVEPQDAFPDEYDVALAIDRVESVTSLRVNRVPHRWAGLRTFASDRSLVAGFATDAPGFFWLVGQGGYGIQTSPAMARYAADLIVRGVPPEDMADLKPALSPARFD